MLFNRPDHTARVLKRILFAGPSLLFVSADGPRKNHPEDVEKCAAVRRIIEEVPKGVRVRQAFPHGEPGMKKAGMTALSWFSARTTPGSSWKMTPCPILPFSRSPRAASSSIETMRTSRSSPDITRWGFPTRDDAGFSRSPLILGVGELAARLEPPPE